MLPDPSPHPSGLDPDTIHAFVRTAHSVDVARWLSRLPADDAAQHLVKLEPTKRASVFGHLPVETQVVLARKFPYRALAQIVTDIDADNRVDIFNRLTPDQQDRLARDLAPEDREDIHRLAAHPNESAGAIMTSNYAVLDAGMNAGQAIAALRDQVPSAESIYRSYVVGSDHRLTGSVRLHALVLAADDLPPRKVPRSDCQ